MSTQKRKYIPVAVRRLANSLGLTLRLRTVPDDEYQYDPKTRVLYAESVGSLVHEIAHYLVATPRERKRPNFLLGSGPDGGLGCRHISAAQRREEEASLLGILIERELGTRLEFPCRDFPKGSPAYQFTWDYHNWGCRSGRDTARKTLHRLIKAGMVTKLPGGRFRPVMSPRRDGRAARWPDGSFYLAVLPPQHDGRAANS